MAFLYNQVSSQLSLFPHPYHIPGVSDGLFTAVYNYILKEMGGQVALNRIKRRELERIVQELNAEGNIIDLNLRSLFSQHDYLRIMIYVIDDREGVVKALVSFPFCTLEKEVQAKAVRKVKNELKILGGVTTDDGQVKFIIPLLGEDKPVKVKPQKGDNPGMDISGYYMTLREQKKSGRKILAP